MFHFEWNAEQWILHPAGAVYWPRAESVLIADTHFGKGASFRAQGIPLPFGSTTDSLRNLDDVVRSFSVKRLFVLGDFFHARTSQSPDVLNHLQAWREANSGIDVVVIRGNHDRHAGDSPSSLGFVYCDEPHEYLGILLCHFPRENPAIPIIAGHIHPGVVLHGAGRMKLRTACLWIQPRQMIVPAFGALTGIQEIMPSSRDRVIAISGSEVFEVPFE